MWRVCTLLVAVGLLLGGQVAPAQAADAGWSSSAKLQNVATKGCAVEPPGYRDMGDVVVLRDCANVDKDQWVFKTLFFTDCCRVVQIKNKYSDLCLAPNTHESNTWIHSTYCVHPTGGRPTSTKWKVVHGDYGYITFINRWTHKCLGITRYYQENNTGRYMAQKWCDSTKHGQLWGGANLAIQAS